VRNSVGPDTAAHLHTAEWAAFTTGVKDSEFDFTNGAGE